MRGMAACTELLFRTKTKAAILVQMGFIMEFAENLILRLMEDPNERDRKSRERIYDKYDKGKKFLALYNLPLRPYGFWTFERHNAQIFWDAQIS
ncbi:hypothetical protein ABFX02_07G110600 [Erythranthe guttata]